MPRLFQQCWFIVICSLGEHLHEIPFKIELFRKKEMGRGILTPKCRPVCLGHSVLIRVAWILSETMLTWKTQIIWHVSVNNKKYTIMYPANWSPVWYKTDAYWITRMHVNHNYINLRQTAFQDKHMHWPIKVKLIATSTRDICPPAYLIMLVTDVPASVHHLPPCWFNYTFSAKRKMLCNI